MRKLLLIDGDSIIYHSLRDTIIESFAAIDEKIHNMFEKTEGTDYVIFISIGKYFRHDIDPSYKQSREKYRDNKSNKWVQTLKQYLIAEWNAQWVSGVEADDLVAYWYNKPIFVYKGITKNILLSEDEVEVLEKTDISLNKIICSPDKDILQSIKGKHFNYSYKLTDEAKQAKKDDPEYVIKDEDVIKGWWVETSMEYADSNFMKSLIIGDSTDNIKGVEGKGKVYADKLYDALTKKDVFRSIILNEYCLKYGQSQGIYEFQKNYRLLHLLDCDEDFLREVKKLPTFPIINEIKRIEEVEKIDEF